MLIDPLGLSPLVVTGSANFSCASVKNNDENMLFIAGDSRVADIYFTEFWRLFRHWRFRHAVAERSWERSQHVPNTCAVRTAETTSAVDSAGAGGGNTHECGAQGRGGGRGGGGNAVTSGGA